MFGPVFIPVCVALQHVKLAVPHEQHTAGSVDKILHLDIDVSARKVWRLCQRDIALNFKAGEEAYAGELTADDSRKSNLIPENGENGKVAFQEKPQELCFKLLLRYLYGVHALILLRISGGKALSCQRSALSLPLTRSRRRGMAVYGKGLMDFRLAVPLRKAKRTVTNVLS